VPEREANNLRRSISKEASLQEEEEVIISPFVTAFQTLQKVEIWKFGRKKNRDTYIY
jgi:hypothetical protein